MLTIGGSLLSSLQAQQTRLANASHNIANAQTPGFRPMRTSLVERPEGGVDAITTRSPADPPTPDLVADLVETLDAAHAYAASAAALRRTHDTLGSFVDALA